MLKAAAGVCICMYMLHAVPTYTGSEGYITMPSAYVADMTRLAIGLKYTHNGQLSPSINYVPFHNIELGMGWDYHFPCRNKESTGLCNSTGINPLLCTAKVQILPNGFLSAGGTAEIGMGKEHTNYFSFHHMFRRTFHGFDITFGAGYTVGNGTDFNFFAGFLKQILTPRVVLIGDISNTPYRYHTGSGRMYSDPERAIANLALHFILSGRLSLVLGGLDLMDSNRAFMCGINFIPNHVL